MEGLKLRTALLAGTLLLAGTAFTLTGSVKHEEKSEDWVASQLPSKMGNYTMVPGNEGPSCSYKMDAKTYEILRPWGIVARIFDNGDKAYDVVVISSREKESFHDPRQCFSAQGWNIESESFSTIPTKTRGNVGCTVVQMSSADQGKKTAIYFYKGPGGFQGRNKDIKSAMFWEQLLDLGRHMDGAFYRVIPVKGNPSDEELKQFAGEWLDSANSTSNGYF